MAPKIKRGASSSEPGTTYQVFLSFRGPDTRVGFTDVLYHALTDAGLRVFRDNEEIRKGVEIGDEISAAIDQSWVFVPIFSRGYAYSQWCLIELAKMFESMWESSGKKKILPIYYDVSVDDVKLRTNLYVKALTEHRMTGKFSTDTVRQWKEALIEAGRIKGYELRDQGFGEFARSFVREVSLNLKVKHTLVTDYLVPRDDQVEALMKLLDIDSPGVRFVGIHGMGGIGKTTLARVVFNKLCDLFDQSCFLADVRESSSHHKGIEKLQEQLFESAGLKLGEIKHKDDGIMRIRETFPHKKLLLVLDDIGHNEQMQYLAGDASWFGSGSRIIITTRDQSLFSSDVPILEVESMKAEEALRLFSMHAFNQDSPPNEYLSLSKEVVASAGEFPLALEVLGSYLYMKNYREYWVKIINRLKKYPPHVVQEKLMISYDTLTEDAKEIFLDIACFFIGHDKTYPMYMWKACRFYPEERLKELINVSLVKIVVKEEFVGGVKSETLWMHNQVRDMGRNIARRSRIWKDVEAVHVVASKEVYTNIEMLRLNTDSQQLPIGSLPKLRYLEFEGTKLDLEGPLPRLIWLSLVGVFSGNGSSCLTNLVVLVLDDFGDNYYLSEDWEGWSQIGAKLKVLDISNCVYLTKTPDLSNYASLERLTLQGCRNLVEIHPSIGKLKCLKFLNILRCSGVKQLPDSIGDLKSLVELRLLGCRIMELPDIIGELMNMRLIDISWTYIQKLPTSIGMLKRLEELHAFSCPSLAEIPPTIEGCSCLRVLDLRYSGVLQLPPELPPSLTNLRDSPTIAEVMRMNVSRTETRRRFRH